MFYFFFLSLFKLFQDECYAHYVLIHAYETNTNWNHINRFSLGGLSILAIWMSPYLVSGGRGGCFHYYYTVELQWLKHRSLVYHGCFELVLVSLGRKSYTCRHYYIWDNVVWFSVSNDNGMLCVLIKIASMRRFLWEHITYHHVKENRKVIPIMPPDLVL